MTVIEVRGRGGQLVERLRLDKEIISIGRAFDNDVILEDAYVSPHHLVLSVQGKGWVAKDLESENGVQLRKHKMKPEQMIRSGDRLRVGHTYLYCYEDSHVVSPALKVDSAEARLAALGNHWLWPILIVLSAVLMVLESYTRSFTEYKPLQIVQPALWSLLGVVFLAAFWALVGRLIRHRAIFFSHLSIWYLYGLGVFCAGFVTDIIAYNFSSGIAQDVIGKMGKFLMLLIAIWASLTLATNLVVRKRFWSAFGLAAGVIAIGIAGQFRWHQEFSAAPSYYSMIKKPVYLWRKGISEDQVVQRLPELLAEADKEADKDQPAGGQ